MSTPSDHDDATGATGTDDAAGSSATSGGGDAPKVDLGKSADEPFDPYRYGRPDHPIPPEYAPPGYVPDPVPPAGAAPGGPYPYGSVPYGTAPHGQAPYPPPPYPQGPYPPSPYPQSPYPHHPYPGAPGPYGMPPKTGSNGMAITALVLGIASIVMCFLIVFDVALIIPAVVFGILGLRQAKARGGVGRNLAVAGLACATVGAVLAGILTVVALRAIDDCGGLSQSQEPGFQECVQDKYMSGRDPLSR